jgi:acetyltransferase
VTRALDSFFTPRSIAVVGASRNPQKLGYVLLDNLQRGRFRGALYPVNPNAEAVLGLPAYAHVDDIAEPVDLAVLTVPATAVTEVIDECGRKGVPAAVVITAGFRETGPEGAARERELLARARAAGVRLVGPNSVGVINTFANVNATFAESAPTSYEVALISQSGAIATAILDWARAIGVGFSKFVSLGNMADVNEVDLIDYLASDPQTKLIVGYIEGFSDGRRFVDCAKRLTPRKPLVVMKVGRSESGARAAQSHTGSLAGSDAIVDAAFRQAGVIRAYTMDELFDFTLAFSYLRPPAGDRIGVVTNAGGPGVMTADAIERVGLRLATLSPVSRNALAEALPAAASSANPIDVLGDAPSERYRMAVEIVLRDPDVDAVIVLLTPQAVTEPEATARVLAYLARMHDKPLMGVYMGGDAVARGRLMLDSSHVPGFHYPERAVRAMAALVAYGRYRGELHNA